MGDLNHNIIDQNLIKTQAFIDGKWVDALSGQTTAIYNPANNNIIAHVADCNGDDTKKAIISSQQAQPAWAAKTAKERHTILMYWVNLMMENHDALAHILTIEQGKPLAEARGEITIAANYIEWYAEEGRRAYGDTIPTNNPAVRLSVIKQPVGVTAGITPWNFPASMITRKGAAALAAGCSFILKPAPETPIMALALAKLAHDAGVPAGVFNIVTAGKDNAIAVGKALTDSPIVRKLGFTGSTPVGKILMQQCAAHVKKISLELGGNAPFIVFNDADIDAAIAGVMVSKFRNAGQTCICANRILVQDGIYDTFMDKFASAIDAFKLGNGLDDNVTIGPLINQQAVEKADRLLHDALQKKAKNIIAGGAYDHDHGYFCHPSLIGDVSEDMDIFHTEIFGPVASVMRFKHDDDAVKLANNTQFGLAAYFYSRDVGRCHKISEQLEYGMVGINTGAMTTVEAPFGGIKESGLGHEGSHQGLLEWMEQKYICTGL